MAVAHSAPHGGVFGITKTRLMLALSLAITWWFAHLLPHYQPMLRAEFSSRLAEARMKIPSISIDWTPSEDPRARYDSSKIALIIEPRPIPHLVPQLLHMISVVPPDWRFVFIGTNRSVISVGRSFATKHQQVIGKLDLMILPEPWSIETKEHVYRLLTDVRFYDEFLPGVEWILKFEHDSILCSNSPTGLNEWLEWDWAGAPRSAEDRFSGNGGLSLRRVSKIRQVLTFQERYNNTEAEDEWFGKRLWVLPGAKVAHGTEGALAVEDVYMDSPMGYHIRNGGEGLSEEVWKNPDTRKKIFNYCPELSLIMDMKLERERCDGDNRQGEIGPTAGDKAKAAKDFEEERRKKLEESRRKKQKEAEKKKQEEAEAKKKQEEEDAKKKQEEEEAKRKEEEDAPPTADMSEEDRLKYDFEQTKESPEKAPQDTAQQQDEAASEPANEEDTSNYPDYVTDADVN